MSIVTYETDAPVFDIEFFRYLFRDGLVGGWIDYQPDYAFSDTGWTNPAAPGEGVASYLDRGPYGYNDTQPVITARPILGRVPVGGRRNLFRWSQDFDNAAWSGNHNATPNAGIAPDGTETLTLFSGASNLAMDVPVAPGETYTLSLWVSLATATRHNVRFYDVTNSAFITESINSGASSTLSRISRSVTVPEGCTVMRTQIVRVGGGSETDGSVYIWGAQLEKGSEETPYQRVTTAYDVTEAGVPSVYYAHYDGADDVLPSSLTIPSISEGCFILVGTAGIWIDNEYSNTSGSLSVGPTTYTGGPAGILPVVGDVLSIIVRDEPLTEQERQKVIQAGIKRGSPGEIE